VVRVRLGKYYSQVNTTKFRYKNAIVDSIDIDDGAIKQALFNIENCGIPSVQNRIRLFHCPAQEFTSPPLSQTKTATKTTIPHTPESSVENNEDDSNPTTRDKQENLNSFFLYSPSFELSDTSNGIYDLIICAPPYFKSDESTGIFF
jgi:hypothetical protein